MASNFGRLSDKLKDADLERRMEEEEVSRLSAASNTQRSNARCADASGVRGGGG